LRRSSTTRIFGLAMKTLWNFMRGLVVILNFIYSQTLFYFILLKMQELNWDLDDSSKWSKMLVEAEKKKPIEESQVDSLFQDDEDETPKKMELLFDMPMSFTPDPIISQEGLSI
jgi:hypothetical protein